MTDSGDDIIDRVSKDEYVDFENTENQMFDDVTNGTMTKMTKMTKVMKMMNIMMLKHPKR